MTSEKIVFLYDYSDEFVVTATIDDYTINKTIKKDISPHTDLIKSMIIQAVKNSLSIYEDFGIKLSGDEKEKEKVMELLKDKPMYRYKNYESIVIKKY